ncbi:hypothetical protein AKJ09_02356 [Labilithrix luteola]|uniref:Type IV fimbrial biogenesis protein PilY1 n=1 Tax=Labilithrix luteola TaxID=1391654 RepID=A0A0K1PQ89_9BACT|nr:hypothetical protein [Labilithrix luteola]AKU95692.1 hypothetical protein AKJ09_02356 [Labilithrix luteola]
MSIAGVFGVTLLCIAAASCAEANEDAGGPPDAGLTTIPDAEIDGALDGSDASDASDAGNIADPCTTSAACPVATPLSPLHALRAIRGKSASDVWAVGSGGTILHFDGTSWTLVSPVTDRTLSAVAFGANGDVWVGGSSRALFRRRSSSASWENVAFVPPSMYGLDTLLLSLWSVGGDVWAGGGCAHALDTTSMLWAASSTTDDAGSGDGGADAGLVAWRSVGTFCRSGDPRRFVSASWGVGDTLWTCGYDDPDNNGGAVYRMTELSAETPTTEAFDSQALGPMRAVWGNDEHDVWFVGTAGVIRRFRAARGNILDYVAPVTNETLNGIWGSRADDIWVVGDHGTVLHYDGRAWRSWTLALVSGEPNLYGVWGSDADHVWAVGESGVVRLAMPVSSAQGDAR